MYQTTELFDNENIKVSCILFNLFVTSVKYNFIHQPLSYYD